MRVGGAGTLFGTNGVRGIANKDLTAELALNLGRTIATLKEGKIAVACDTRISSSMLKCAVAAGIMSCGSDVVDLGISPTPALQFYVKNTDCVAGVIITASHNPKEYNGIKFIQENGVEFFREMDEESERLYMSKSFKEVDWSKVGKLIQDDCKEVYVDAVAESVDLDKKYRVVADCGNGAGSFTTPEILKSLECESLVINANPDGRFPARDPEPVERNLEILKKLVIEFRADFGVAHDGDADRAVFVDEKGNFVSEDVVLALMARYYVEKNRGGIVVTPVSTSKVVEDVVKEVGGEVIYTAVGSPVVAKVMIEKNSIFGGEGNGGLIFPEHLVARDGGMSVAKMLQLLDETGKKLSELAAEVPRYFTVKGKIPCKDKIKLLEELKKEFPEANHIDGARIEFKDGWILIRPSGTEPIARIYAESRNKKRAEELYEFGVNVVKKILR
ncbi:MAG: phosphoglucosamine mutase [Archaeoglobaceae archaeon]|nr:phosphoglucosamine mutase [Archaeoglobaceae archaeon]MCX8151917.1 phosphoglucosamine mutase [Archaeoglobaceae archaeon]MDW8013306.1 phosphoglucosamine mutase [Archaeoglobaceae archaeon]